MPVSLALAFAMVPLALLVMLCRWRGGSTPPVKPDAGGVPPPTDELFEVIERLTVLEVKEDFFEGARPRMQLEVVRHVPPDRHGFVPPDGMFHELGCDTVIEVPTGDWIRAPELDKRLTSIKTSEYPDFIFSFNWFLNPKLNPGDILTLRTWKNEQGEIRGYRITEQVEE